MDVANEASVIAGLDGREAGFGPVRGLVNSAGIGCDIPAFDTERAPQNIRAIAAGPVETPPVQALQTDKMRAEWISEVPQRRYASPDVISGAALFLLDHSKAGSSPRTFSTSMEASRRADICRSGRSRNWRRLRSVLLQNLRIFRQAHVIPIDIDIP
jgi:NAD(P)-dependent dehydrogenase (short-subunit alcohol dehydrogenase family)